MNDHVCVSVCWGGWCNPVKVIIPILSSLFCFCFLCVLVNWAALWCNASHFAAEKQGTRHLTCHAVLCFDPFLMRINFSSCVLMQFLPQNVDQHFLITSTTEFFYTEASNFCAESNMQCSLLKTAIHFNWNDCGLLTCCILGSLVDISWCRFKFLQNILSVIGLPLLLFVCWFLLEWDAFPSVVAVTKPWIVVQLRGQQFLVEHFDWPTDPLSFCSTHMSQQNPHFAHDCSNFRHSLCWKHNRSLRALWSVQLQKCELCSWVKGTPDKVSCNEESSLDILLLDLKWQHCMPVCRTSKWWLLLSKKQPLSILPMANTLNE